MAIGVCRVTPNNFADRISATKVATGDSENLRLPTTTNFKVSIYKVSVPANEARGLLNKMLYREAPPPKSNPLTGGGGGP